MQKKSYLPLILAKARNNSTYVLYKLQWFVKLYLPIWLKRCQNLLKGLSFFLCSTADHIASLSWNTVIALSGNCLVSASRLDHDCMSTPPGIVVYNYMPTYIQIYSICNLQSSQQTRGSTLHVPFGVLLQKPFSRKMQHKRMHMRCRDGVRNDFNCYLKLTCFLARTVYNTLEILKWISFLSLERPWGGGQDSEWVGGSWVGGWIGECVNGWWLKLIILCISVGSSVCPQV